MRAYVLLFFILFCSCATNRMVETNLYFAMMKPDGSMIPDKEWDNFKEATLFKVFEKGASTYEVTGNWRDNSGKLITERSHMVSFLHPKSRAVSRQIDSVCLHYKTRFAQESVLRVDKSAEVVFY